MLEQHRRELLSDARLGRRLARAAVGAVVDAHADAASAGRRGGDGLRRVAGERHVYRKRGIKQPDIGAPQRLPKRVRFVFDISGSMYRFNGEDSRLDRTLEAATMFMEALQGFEHKIVYSMHGHSGDSPEIELVDYARPPTNKKERFKVLQTMFAHAQYCSSGDETLADLELESPFELLGLYRGISLDQKSVNDSPTEMDMIFLYRRPLLDFWCETGEELGTLVRHVLIHEIGHHFGYSDEDMEAIEARAR